MLDTDATNSDCVKLAMRQL